MDPSFIPLANKFFWRTFSPPASLLLQQEEVSTHYPPLHPMSHQITWRPGKGPCSQGVLSGTINSLKLQTNF